MLPNNQHQLITMSFLNLNKQANTSSNFILVCNKNAHDSIDTINHFVMSKMSSMLSYKFHNN
jgi:hypothetical protein